jgi:hypothetical protein
MGLVARLVRCVLCLTFDPAGTKEKKATAFAEQTRNIATLYKQ